MFNDLYDQCAAKARSCGIRTTVSYFMAIIFGVFVSAAWSTPQFPVHFNDDRRYLVDQAGKPFFINGDTPWSLITGLTKSEAELYLNDRQQRGFNAIIVNLIEHFYNGPVNQEGHGPFLVAGDFSTPNDAYFAHADWILNKALEKGFAVFMTAAYLGYQCGNEGWCAEVRDNGPEKMYQYGRYVGQRFRNFPNILWIGGGDTNASGYPDVTEAMEAMIEGISQSTPSHLFTAHCDRNTSAVDCYDRPWLDINNTYSDCTKTAPLSLSDYRRGRPFFFFEGRYENESATDVCLRSQAYWSVLAGSMGHFFGNNPIWKFERGWESALGSTGALSMTHMRNLFLSRNWTPLVPDESRSFMTSGRGALGTAKYAAAAVNSNNSTFIAYLPTSRRVRVNTLRLKGDSVCAWWYNPSSGESSKIGTFGKGEIELTPPSEHDWVLVIDEAALNLPPPGSVDFTMKNQSTNVHVF